VKRRDLLRHLGGHACPFVREGMSLKPRPIALPILMPYDAG